MSIQNPIPFRNYAEPMRVDAQHSLPLARRLKNTKPDDATPEETARLEAVQSSGEAVASTLTDRDRASTARVRAPLLLVIAFMGAMFGSLIATAALPETASDRSARAKRILTMFFPDGLSFTRLDAHGVWSESHRRLDQVKKDGLVAEIAALTGPEFYPVAVKATDDLGEAIGVGVSPLEPVNNTALQENLVIFARAVAAYARLLAARVDDEDPASVERFRKAVAPIDEYRDARGRSPDSDDEEDASEPASPDTPAAPGEPFDPGGSPFLPDPPS